MNKQTTPHKKSRTPLILSIIAGILAVVFVAGLLTNWFGLYGPGTKILLAGKNTLSTGNFTVTYSVNGQEKSTLLWDMDLDAREFTLVAQDPSGKITTAIYKGYRIYDHSYGGNTYIYATDIQDDLSDLFDMITRLQEDLDIDSILTDLDELLDGKLSQLFDLKTLSRCLLGLYRDFNSDRWLEENAGFSQEKSADMTLYRFRPDTYRLLNDCLDSVQPAFRDGGYADVKTSLDKNRELLSQLDYQLTLGVETKKLVSIQLQIADLGDLSFRFSNFDSTSIQTAPLDQLLDQAKYF